MYSRYPENLGALPCPRQASFKPMSQGRKASMEVGPCEACQGVRIPSMRRGPFCQKCFRAPRPAPGPSMPWIPHDGVLCRHPDSVLRAPLFSCRQPPIPVHDSRLQDSTWQAHETRSGGQVVIVRARLPSRAAARQNSRFLIHPIPAYGPYRHSRRSLTNGRSCQAPSPAPP